MVKNLIRAIRLEFNFLRQSKVNLILYLIIPALFAYFFGLAGQISVSWKEGVTYFVLYAPTVLPLFMLFMTTQLTIMRIVGERAPYGTLDRDLLSLSRTSIFFGKLIISCIIAIIQALVVLVISYNLFHLPVNPILLLFILILVAIFGVALGLVISVISSNKEQASQIVPFLILTLFIFNGTIISLDTIMSPIKNIVSSLPLATATDSLTRMINSNHGFYELKDNLFFLVIWIFIITLFGWIKFCAESLKK
jgi:ABC-type polysaccharide/polyol phosphate export permease